MKLQEFLKNQKGLTLVELIVASVVVAIMVLFIGNFLIYSFENTKLIEGLADLGNYSQQTVNRLRLDISQSRKIFDESVSGKGYYDSLEFPSGVLPLAQSKLPEIIEHGSLSPSKVDDFRNPFVQPAVGNVLFYAESLPAFEEENQKRTIDLYRFIIVFLQKKETGQLNQHFPFVLDLVRCESPIYADLFQIRDIEDPVLQNNLLDRLQENEVEALWDVTASADVAFAETRSYSSKDDRLLGYKIPLRRCVPVISGLGKKDRSTGVMTYSVALNQQDHFQIKTQVPLFAQKEGEGVEGFPHGFEVLMVGPKSGRQVLIRLVLAAPLRTQILSRDSIVIATVKDS